MNRYIWKPVLFGVALGAALYFVPFFFFRGFLFLLLIVLVARLFWFRRHGWYRGGFHPAFADVIRNMSPEEYEAFRKKYDSYGCYPGQAGRESKPQA
jgi:hypothetical protein